ncbi:MAG TPA: metalloregulator ArsR/SmtB family transcription factor [Anaerovoracaceae bacterium]|nr:metalloregulator ArsR/SmtB family transcription factor [Anaerovoracaceae bacterium]
MYRYDKGVVTLDIVNVLKGLSDETRLRILNLLYEKELCVCDITESLGIMQTKASRHLSYLKKAGLIKSRKQAQWVYYSIIKDEGTAFIGDLIEKSLRNSDPYDADLIELAAWIKKKNIDC